MPPSSPKRGAERRVDAATVRFLPGGVVRVEGRILSPNAIEEFGICLARFHENATRRRRRIVVDVAGLEWLSEAAVKVLVTWVLWVQHEPPERRYVVVFNINPGVPWQRGTFEALLGVAPDVVAVEGG